MGKIFGTPFYGVYSRGEEILTKNLTPGFDVYGEDLIEDDGEYRVWNSRRSKLSAMLHKGAKTFPFRADSRVLYLGAATGTTASHISDIVHDGLVYCVEISQRPFRSLLGVCERRKNMIPILGDANSLSYGNVVPRVDVVYQDIAQRDQTRIFLKNVDRFLSPTGIGMIMIKARSINVSEEPAAVFEREIRSLKENLEILEAVPLEPYEKDHMAVVVRNR